jgi:hypothetical protein
LAAKEGKRRKGTEKTNKESRKGGSPDSFTEENEGSEVRHRKWLAGAAVSTNAPRPLYVEAVLPSPDGSVANPIRKAVSTTDSRVSFDGQVLSGWKPGSIYLFRLRAYADADYTRVVDSLEQRSLCSKPPENYLKQLKDE